MQLKENSLYYGDCLEVMQQWDAEQADLIYLDPPFNSNTNYNILFSVDAKAKMGLINDAASDKAQLQAFTDTWAWSEEDADRYQQIKGAVAASGHKIIVAMHDILGASGMLSYLMYMAERLRICRKLLKCNGSIYLHCDPTASHYLKLLMDDIFGKNNFRNELIWYYPNASRGKKELAHAHDAIFWYSKDSLNYTFKRNEVLMPFTSKMTEWRYTKGRQAGKPMPKGKTPDDVIVLPSLNAMAKERTGYPTQKPEELLEFIIKASTSEGDLVLDPFCGCGTTMAVSNKLQRKWVGIDISAFAVDIVKKVRLRDDSIPVIGIPYDVATAKEMAKKNRFQFEKWAITRIPGLAPNDRQTGDEGIDGRGTTCLAKSDIPRDYRNLVLAQVKSGEKFDLSHFRDFLGVVDRHRALFGIYITIDKQLTVAAKKEMSRIENLIIEIGKTKYPRVQLWTMRSYFESNNRTLPNLPPMNDPYTGKQIQRDLFVS